MSMKPVGPGGPPRASRAPEPHVDEPSTGDPAPTPAPKREDVHEAGPAQKPSSAPKASARGLIDAKLADIELPADVAAMIPRVLSLPGVLTPYDLSHPVRLALQDALPRELKGLVSHKPHPGIAQNPFDLKKMVDVTLDEKKALIAYLDRDFVRLPIEKKEPVLTELDRLFSPKGRTVAKEFHLPRLVDGKPITLSLESEASLRKRAEVLNYYAPDPSGKLDPKLLPNWFLNHLLKNELAHSGNAQSWLRMTPDAMRSALRWKDLGLKSRIEYLENYEVKVDPKVSLYRIKDPHVAPEGVVAPKSLCNKLLWEGRPLGITEMITETYYQSRDHLSADIAFIDGLGPMAHGYHVHQVVELSTPQKIAEIGPAMTGLTALLDLMLFTAGTRSGGNLFHHTHLEVWQAEAINDVAKSLAGGVLDPDAIDVHKFHCAGMRLGIYGDESRLGIETRGVPMGSTNVLERAVDHTTAILAGGHTDKLGPPPPWSWWNAGDPKLPKEAFEAALDDPELAERFPDAQIDFDTLFQLAGGKTADRDKFKYAAPLWNFEGLPGVTAKEKDDIEFARRIFVGKLLEISTKLSDAIEAGREVDSAKVDVYVEYAVRGFFQRVNIDQMIDRALEHAARGEQP